MTDPRSMISAFVAEHAGETMADDADIFASGRINSLFAVQLVMWVERTFGIPVQGDDLDIANFRTIDDVTAFVSARVDAPAPAGSDR
jgi:methoxymalonate biosynthesis acyl carrier protein